MSTKSARYIEIQRELAKQVKLRPIDAEIKTIAGLDVSSNLYSNILYAGIVVLSYPELKVLEEVTAKAKTNFPYIPGLLSFREIPALLKAFEKLSRKPSVLIIDGQGVAHPRRLGIASHFGVITGIPSIGCAKSVLTGRVEGERLLDQKTCELLGAVIETKKRARPLIVSPGHLITLPESVAIVRKTLRGYRLPEPTRLAHTLVNKFRLENK